MADESELCDSAEQHEIRERHLDLQGHVIDVTSERFDYDGGQLTRQFVEHPGAVGVLAIDDLDRVALVHQYRHPVRERLWEVPAGLLDVPGELPLDAAKRELAEEAELVAEHWLHLIDMYTTPGGSNERLRMYRATGLSPAAHFERTAEEQDMGLTWRAFDEVLDAVLSGRLHNPTLVVSILAEAANRSRRG
ncbi:MULTISPECIES: NUDIX domain-containing protein [unclassified Pseudoclavibacter]|uniref:NUDIX domain-containing protein n=1 Tax=unclassified Pseudoclavibacter TaxID=2615177 RepID=UPI00130123CB|nr:MULTISPECIES: NUDIX hydrolase [unclassified Pseudoclavibacter]KAB1658072.1 NUDIX hydrolase [Pseudoclavibacter sp. CFCC 11306]KAB1661981.1 NUDIX hydrolase [Pseudoclavibacter sp. CFCC 13796]